MKRILLILTVLFLVISIHAQKKQPVIKEFTFTDCKDDCQTGIISKKHKWRKLTLVIGVHAHCCMKFEGELEYSGDTLTVNSFKYGHPCRCYCNYEITYVIKGVRKKKLKEIMLFDDWHIDWNTPEKRRAKAEK